MTIMKSMQGYAGVTCRADGKEFDLGKTLVILNDWARIDRHRRLHIAGSAITSGGLRIGSPSGVEYLNFLDTHLLETESEVARFKIRNFVPGMKISFQADFAFEVMIDESPRLRLQEIALAMNWPFVLFVSNLKPTSESRDRECTSAFPPKWYTSAKAGTLGRWQAGERIRRNVFGNPDAS